MEAHINGCAACKRIVASYKTIDSNLRDTLDAATDEGTRTRIRTGSLAKIRTRDDRERARAMWGRAAAIAVCAMALIAMLAYLNIHSRRQLDKLPAAGPAGEPIRWNFSQIALVASAADEEGIKNMQLQLGAAETGVHQVWSVENPHVPLQLIRGLLQPQHREDVARLMQAQTSRHSVMLEVEPHQLQELINRLHANGCRLLSEEGPQPGNPPEQTTLGDKPIHYMADFVRP